MSLQDILSLGVDESSMRAELGAGEQAALDLSRGVNHNSRVARICTLLALLLLVLTFNAYACVLPVPSQSGMDCSSHTEEPVRQTCDAFLDLGPQSQESSHHDLTTATLDVEVVAQLPVTVFSVLPPDRPPRTADSPIHFSIQTTVLRI